MQDKETAQVPEIIKKRYESSYEAYMGVRFNSYADSYCEIELDAEARHLNIGNTVHGGVINALCDIALSGAVTCNFIDKAESVVTMQMNVYFLRPGFEGDTLKACGRVIKMGGTIAYVEGEIINQKGELIAKASGDWFIKRPKNK
jgi:uncharacterized protein (TIGR00369 family)